MRLEMPDVSMWYVISKRRLEFRFGLRVIAPRHSTSMGVFTSEMHREGTLPILRRSLVNDDGPMD